MANTILITANWHTGALSQQTISRQYDNNRYVVQFVGYPEASEGNELDYYLLVWMSSAPGERPDEIAPIQLASDQWYISNVFTQQTQQIKFQMCALNTEGTFEAHSPIFTGFVRNSLEHDGTTQDIDVSTLFDAYREYLNELIIRSGAVVIDAVPTQGSANAVQSGGVYSALADVNSDVADLDLRVEELEQGGSGGLSMTAVNLLNTILTEAIYGSDQTANIALLHKELSNIPPVSISAVLDGTALAGQSYSELSFTVTATFDDESTQVVDNYTIVTTGTVTAGSNTVTIRYRGITTTCTFTAEQVITYSITYNLTDVTLSNNTTVIRENTRYATEISTDSDHYISAFTVTMGGVDVTATVRNGNNIVIDAVTGNVVITIVANAYVYLDPLIVKRPYTTGGDSITRLYTDEYVTKARPETIAYYHVGKVTEYPAKYDCTLNWTITNTSDSAVSLTGLGFGLIKDTNEYVNNNAIAYWQKIDNVSHSLEAGASLSGTYTMLAGWQLILTVTTDNIDAISESIRGDYVAEDFSEYTTYSITNADLTPKDPYKARTLYSDGGTETLLSHTGNFYQYTTIDSPFVYDAYTRYVPINLSASDAIVQNATGFVNALSDENVYYAQKVAVAKSQMSNLWRHITLKATESNMIWIFTNKFGNQRIDNYSLTVKAKEVSA